MLPILIYFLTIGLIGSASATNATTKNVNNQTDRFLETVAQDLRRRNTHMVSVVDKEIPFNITISPASITGCVRLDGKLGDWSTIKRAGDAILTDSAKRFSLQSNFSTDIHGVLYSSVSWNCTRIAPGMQLEGSNVYLKVHVLLRDFMVQMKIEKDRDAGNDSKPVPELTVLSIGRPSVSIGGLLNLNLAASDPIQEDIDKVLTETLNYWIAKELKAVIGEVYASQYKRIMKQT